MQVKWPMKLQIAEGVVHGMKYLHTKDPPVIHGDLKVQNVLIGDAYIPKVSAVSAIYFLSCKVTISVSFCGNCDFSA